jgi:hypothetical protein
MKEITQRSMVRSFHLVLSIPIIGYIYSPFDVIPDYAFPTRFIFLPAMVLSGCGCGKAMSFGVFSRKDRPDRSFEPTRRSGLSTDRRKRGVSRHASRAHPGP